MTTILVNSLIRNRSNQLTILLFCGLNSLYSENNHIYNLKIFIDTDERLTTMWKVRRDVLVRGHTAEHVINQIMRRREDYNNFILPQRNLSDLIVRQSARVQAGFKLLESSNEQVRATQLSYSHGVKTLMELANAELMLSRRMADQVNAVMEYQKYSARLSRNDLKP